MLIEITILQIKPEVIWSQNFRGNDPVTYFHMELQCLHSLFSQYLALNFCLLKVPSLDFIIFWQLFE